jgi:hypothetical protein
VAAHCIIVLLSRREFLETIIGIKPSESEEIDLSKNDFTNQGEYGKVNGGRYGNQNVVIKQAQSGMEAFLTRAFSNSRDLLKATIEAHRTRRIPESLLQNMRFFGCSFGKTTDGKLVQRYIDGRNVYETLKAEKPPDTGYPDNFLAAILNASNLFRAQNPQLPSWGTA